jgi:ribosome-binding ATPase YchF (GTP1/OBG family)
MKLAVIGLADFPVGKKTIVDKRLNALEAIFRPKQTTPVAIEVLEAAGIKQADAVICEKESKLELIINDLEMAENQLLMAKDENQIKLFTRAKEALERNLCLCEENFTEEEKKTLLNANLLSAKPVYIVDKNEGKSAEEILFAAYYACGMICFFTGTKDKEIKAWPIKKGTSALEAAGAIHSDIKRGFIKVEVIAYEDLIKAQNLIGAKHAMHLEGKEYIVKDAEVLNFRFNV